MSAARVQAWTRASHPRARRSTRHPAGLVLGASCASPFGPPRARRSTRHPAGLVADRLIRTVIDALAQVLSRLEMWDMLAGQSHGFPGLGIAALPRRAEVQRKTSKPANFDAFARGQRIAHDF